MIVPENILHLSEEIVSVLRNADPQSRIGDLMPDLKTIHLVFAHPNPLSPNWREQRSSLNGRQIDALLERVGIKGSKFDYMGDQDDVKLGLDYSSSIPLPTQNLTAEQLVKLAQEPRVGEMLFEGKHQRAQYGGGRGWLHIVDENGEPSVYAPKR